LKGQKGRAAGKKGEVGEGGHGFTKITRVEVGVNPRSCEARAVYAGRIEPAGTLGTYREKKGRKDKRGNMSMTKRKGKSESN